MGDDDPPEELPVDGHQQAARDVPVPPYNQGRGNADHAKRTALIMNHFS